MSSDLSIMGFRDTSGKFKKMMDIKLYCEKQQVSYPTEVATYFGELINESDSCIRDEMSMIKIPLKKITSDYKYGYIIKVKELPKEVKTIEVYIS